MEVGREKDGDSEDAKRRWWKRADEAELDIPSKVGKARSVLFRSEPCWSSASVNGRQSANELPGQKGGVSFAKSLVYFGRRCKRFQLTPSDFGQISKKVSQPAPMSTDNTLRAGSACE